MNGTLHNACLERIFPFWGIPACNQSLCLQVIEKSDSDDICRMLQVDLMQGKCSGTEHPHLWNNAHSTFPYFQLEESLIIGVYIPLFWFVPLSTSYIKTLPE